MTPFTVTADCVGCGACIATCPERAFRIVPPASGAVGASGFPLVRGIPPLVVLAERCTGCAECADVCPVDACREATGRVAA